MSSYREGMAPGAQGIELFWRVWEAPDPTASLLLVHGLGEHSGRYDTFAEILAGSGTSVFSFDLRGHGRSPGPRGDVDAFPRLLEDLLARPFGQLHERLLQPGHRFLAVGPIHPGRAVAHHVGPADPQGAEDAGVGVQEHLAEVWFLWTILFLAQGMSGLPRI